MYWGAKSRFNDLQNVISELSPKMVEFHLTDNDVKHEKLNGKFYNMKYSLHLPEYWDQVLIDPCNLEKLEDNLKVYDECILKGLQLRNKFVSDNKIKIILHPGGATIDSLQKGKKYRLDYYRKLRVFVEHLEKSEKYNNDIEMLVENMPPLPWFYGGQYYSNVFCDPIEIKEYCEKYKIGFCFDVSHMGLYCNYTGFDLIKAIQIVKPYIRQVHIADAKGTDGEGASMGDGNIDFGEVMMELKDLNVAMIPEQMFGHYKNYYEFKKTIEICNQYIGENNGINICTT